ncbi:hypothetical protein [Sorangium sp. So ce363]|uniref:hypothetical protein n=1 Tax=Sorangium sp. So ce363 TaxID=3133304 RepID=UPI003F5F1226
MGCQLDESALRALTELWETAEDRIKRTEQTHTKLPIPAVNELRYAGYHIVQAILATDAGAASGETQKALNHCKRSTYDAAEAEALYHLERIKLFQEDYRTVFIDIPGLRYQDIRRRAREAKDFLLETQKNRDSRDAHYERVIEICDELKGALVELDEARDELNKQLAAKTAEQEAETKRAEEAERKERAKNAMEARRWRIGTAVAFAAFLVSCAALVKERLSAPANASTQTPAATASPQPSSP